MSTDTKNSTAMLTDNGWVVGLSKNKGTVYEIARVHIKQSSYMDSWHITRCQKESIIGDQELLKTLHERFGDEPSDDLDWGF